MHSRESFHAGRTERGTTIEIGSERSSNETYEREGTRMAAGRIISTMVDRIVAGFQSLQIVLFGSHARSTATAGSDVDLLVILPDVRDNRETTVAIRQALGDLPASKDIVVTTPDEIARRGRLVRTVLRAALREGKVVHERS